MQLCKLSYRNIWRNRRRAIITIASVFFAVFFCTVLYCFECGVWQKMIDNALHTQSGHIQIHLNGYWEDKTVDNFMTMDAATIARIEQSDNVESVAPRIETFAMASFSNHSKGVALCGISPSKEAAKSNLSSHIVAGRYLDETDDGALIGEGLAKYLNVSVGDTLALIGQGYHGASAAGLFAIRGILQLPLSEMDNGLVYVSIPAAQQFIDLPDGYSGILIALRDDRRLHQNLTSFENLLGLENDTPPVIANAPTSVIANAPTSVIANVPPSVIANEVKQSPTPHPVIATSPPPVIANVPPSVIANEVKQSPANNYSLLTWHETMQDLLRTSESDKAFAKLMLIILYILVGFGILGTVIMMTNERKHEFAVMLSLGMRRGRLKRLFTIELLLMAAIGVIASLALSIPTVWWFNVHPIRLTGEMAQSYADWGMEPLLPMSTDPAIFTTQIIAIFLLTCLTLIYPYRIISRLKITANRE